jgi:Leucine Rich repeats (2 copies)
MNQLRELDCHQNLLTSLDPLREMKQLSALYCGKNSISTLEPIKAPNLFWLYCNDNQIESLEPLSALKTLQTLYCTFNAIQTLEPLKDLALNYLDCSGNKIVTLEPFVDAKDPPQTFIFDCDTLPDAEIERAIAAWSKKGRNDNVIYGQKLLAERESKGRRSSRMGMKPEIPATEDVLKVVVKEVVVKDFGPRL